MDFTHKSNRTSITLEDVKRGELFHFGGNLYIKGSTNLSKVSVTSLASGDYYFFEPKTEVNPVKYKLTVEY